MAHYTSPEIEELRIIYCHQCKARYVDFGGNMGCLVAHGPNSCCHHNDHRITREQLIAAREALSLRNPREVT